MMVEKVKTIHREWLSVAIITVFCMGCSSGHPQLNDSSNNSINTTANSLSSSSSDGISAINPTSSTNTAQQTSDSSATTANSLTSIANSSTTQPVITTTASAATTTGTSGCIEGDAFTCQVEAAIVQYTNDIRAGVGLAPLKQDFQLSWVARDWSLKQGSMISHTGFPDARVSMFQQKFSGVTVPSISAENVALNSTGTDSNAVGQAFATQWKNSPGHYANMIGPYTSIGVGVYCTSSGSSSSSSSSSDPLSAIISGIFGSFGGSGSCTATQIFAR